MNRSVTSDYKAIRGRSPSELRSQNDLGKAGGGGGRFKSCLQMPNFRLRFKYCSQPAVAAMHGPHSVFDVGQCTVIHCHAEGMSLVDQ